MLKQSLICIFLFCSFLALAQTDSKSILNRSISIQFSNTSLQASLRQLIRVSGIDFSYSTNLIPRELRINESFNEAPLRNVLATILKEANLNYREINGAIVIQKRVYSERKVQGRVVDAATGAPLLYANVFIQNSTQGDASDLEGEFLIEDVPSTAFNLVVSYVGYKSKTIQFNNNQELEGRKFIVELELDPIALETISVTTKAMRRQQFRNQRRLYQRFEREFLGGSENAEKCRIINPNILQFEVLDSLDNYRVTAKDILIIENNALGYRVDYLLEEFRFENGLKMNLGKAKYSDLETKSRRRYSKWEVERDRAYYGSPQHFLKSLIEGELTEEGFIINVVQYDSITSEYTTPLNPLPVKEILTVESTPLKDLYTLKANSNIEVTYRGEYEDSDYKKLYRSNSKGGNYRYTDRKVRSSIALTDNAILSSYQVFGLDVTDVDLFQKSIIFFNEKEILIAYPGQFLDPRNVLLAGWWRWGAFSDWLPINYSPN